MFIAHQNVNQSTLANNNLNNSQIQLINKDVLNDLTFQVSFRNDSNADSGYDTIESKTNQTQHSNHHYLKIKQLSFSIDNILSTSPNKSAFKKITPIKKSINNYTKKSILNSNNFSINEQIDPIDFSFILKNKNMFYYCQYCNKEYQSKTSLR